MLRNFVEKPSCACFKIFDLTLRANDFTAMSRIERHGNVKQQLDH